MQQVERRRSDQGPFWGFPRAAGQHVRMRWMWSLKVLGHGLFAQALGDACFQGYLLWAKLRAGQVREH